MVRRGCDSHSMMPPWSPTILATSASPSPDPVGLVVTNGSNKCGISSSGTPGPLSLTQNSSGSEMRALAPGSDSRTPGRNAVVSAISPPRGIFADRLGGVLDQVQKHLNELIAVRQHRRQRRIVILDEFDVPGEAGLRQPLHVIEHDMDVDRLALDRPLVGEDFHAVDQFHDAVGFVANQPRQRAVVVVRRLLEQLRRAADAGQADS